MIVLSTPSAGGSSSPIVIPNVIHLSPLGSDTTGDGSLPKPYATIEKALAVRAAASTFTKLRLLGNGVYGVSAPLTSPWPSGFDIISSEGALLVLSFALEVADTADKIITLVGEGVRLFNLSVTADAVESQPGVNVRLNLKGFKLVGTLTVTAPDGINGPEESGARDGGDCELVVQNCLFACEAGLTAGNAAEMGTPGVVIPPVFINTRVSEGTAIAYPIVAGHCIFENDVTYTLDQDLGSNIDIPAGVTL